MSKLTIKEVRKRFKDCDCQLLEKIWINNKTKMKFRCQCGDIDEVSLNSFDRGQRCKKCGSEKKSSKLRYSYKYVKRYFKECGCVLLSKTYQNNLQKLDYVCVCGNRAKIRFGVFKRGSRCRKCGSEKMKNAQKHSYEYVKKYFDDHGCTLLSKTYKKAVEPLDYICNCGNQSQMIFNNFQRGHRCNRCGVEKTRNITKLTYEYVKKYFNDHGCILLSKAYENNSTYLDYICNCGDVCKITFGDFKSGSRCRRCGIKKDLVQIVNYGIII